MVRVSVTTGSIRRYLDSTEVARVVQMLHDGTSICAIGRRFVVSQQSHEHGGDSRTQAVTLGKLDTAIEGP